MSIAAGSNARSQSCRARSQHELQTKNAHGPIGRPARERNESKSSLSSELFVFFDEADFLVVVVLVVIIIIVVIDVVVIVASF